MAGDSDTVIERAHARTGRVLRDKWRLDRLLGVGGMAAVYEATHRNGKRAAIKMLHANLSIGGDTLKRFLREGYVANKVDHPNAVSVLDDDVAEDGSVFVVMELLEGETLQAHWERADQRLPASEVLLLADQVLDVLAAAHAHNIVHRDIKPENIFLTAQGSTKVLDFGIARLRETEGTQGTSQGSFLGTPAFTPPEQARGEWERVDARTDIWAVGATMFTLLSGRWVHKADTVSMQIITVATQPAPPLASVAPDVPPQVASLVDRALAFDPAMRWSSARDMQGALRGAYLALTGVPSPLIAGSIGSGRPPQLEGSLAPVPAPHAATAAPVSREAKHSIPMTGSSLTAWLVAGVGLAIVIGGGAFVTLRGDRSPAVAPAITPLSLPPTATPTPTATATPTPTASTTPSATPRSETGAPVTSAPPNPARGSEKPSPAPKTPATPAAARSVDPFDRRQ